MRWQSPSLPLLPSPFLPPNTPIYFSPLFFKIVNSFFINWYFMHLYLFYIYIPKCNPLNLYTITCMYVFRAGHLTLGEQLASLPWRRSPCLLPALLSYLWICAVVRAHGLFPIQLSMFVGVILVEFTFGWSCRWDFMGIISDVTKGQSFTATSLIT